MTAEADVFLEVLQNRNDVVKLLSTNLSPKPLKV